MKIPVIDCHCHVYPDKIADKAVESIHRFYDIDMGYDGRSSTLIEKGSENGIKHYIVFSVATTPKQVQSINAFIADTVKNSGGIMTGLGSLHPDSDNVAEDYRHLKELGLKGVKLHPDFQKIAVDDERCEKIYELCRGDLPVLLHTGDDRYDFSNPDRLVSVLRKYPDLTVIGAHFGGWSVWEEAAEKLSGYPNFYVDCSSSFDWLTAEKATEIVKAYGADKVLFGTDFPMWEYERELERFFKMELTAEETEKILYKNAVKVFNIDVSKIF
ncbi:MAG: amidohydrolase [Clostridia bacterium]|nr:amidohydrolase [Clostridia bacterium]